MLDFGDPTGFFPLGFFHRKENLCRLRELGPKVVAQEAEALEGGLFFVHERTGNEQTDKGVSKNRGTLKMHGS